MKRKTTIALICIPLLLALCLVTWANAPGPSLERGAKADRILILKGERKLVLLRDGAVLGEFEISLGFDPVGPKTRSGDGRTPEGTYKIDFRKRDSSFHRALHISYPRRDQIEEAERDGRDPGSLIMIHGLRNGFGWIGRMHRFSDWTSGCVAVTNPEIEMIWDSVPDGTPVEIRP